MNASSQTTKANDGFTLTDLLVVIATIAVLAVLLLPAQARTRSGATATGCQGNLEQIGRAIQMYAADSNDYFVSPPLWFTSGPYHNSKGLVCGGEWTGTGLNLSANTPAPMLASYLPNSLVWVCPKRKRGLTYVTQGGEFDPSITGYLSYGFNMIGVFSRPDGAGNMVNATKVKTASLSRPASTVACPDVSGGNDPNGSTSSGALLDTIWLGLSGPLSSPTPGSSYNYRLQTAYAKHNNRLNILYADGHAGPTPASQITWGQFAGVFEPNVPIPSASGPSKLSSDFISSPAYDSIEWSSVPE